MHYSYKKFPELQHLDPKSQYHAMKFCIKKSKLFNYLFFPCLLFVSFLAITISEKIVQGMGFQSGPIIKLLVTMTPVFIINFAFIMLSNATVVHRLVKSHIHEYEQT